MRRREEQNQPLTGKMQMLKLQAPAPMYWQRGIKSYNAVEGQSEAMRKLQHVPVEGKYCVQAMLVRIRHT